MIIIMEYRNESEKKELERAFNKQEPIFNVNNLVIWKDGRIPMLGEIFSLLEKDDQLIIVRKDFSPERQEFGK